MYIAKYGDRSVAIRDMLELVYNNPLLRSQFVQALRAESNLFVSLF